MQNLINNWHQPMTNRALLTAWLISGISVGTMLAVDACPECSDIDAIIGLKAENILHKQEFCSKYCTSFEGRILNTAQTLAITLTCVTALCALQIGGNALFGAFKRFMIRQGH